jgi:Domain of unknown function (DUF4129)
VSGRPAAERIISAPRAWRWIDDGFLPSALALMRATWIWLLIHVWSALMQPERGDMLPPLLIAGLLLGGTLATQLTAPQVAPLPGQRARRAGPGLLLVAGGGLFGVALALYVAFGSNYAPWDMRWFAALFSIPLATLLTVVMATWLWTWGVLAGRARLYYDVYAHNFALGVGGLALAVALAYGTGIIPAVQAVMCALLFFALGLGILAIASVQSTRQIERRRSEQSFKLSRFWLGMVAAVIGALLLAGLLLAQLFTPGVVGHILAGLGLVVDLLAHVLLLLVYAITYPLFMLFDLIRRLIGPVGGKAKLPQITPPAALADQFKDIQQAPAAVSPGLYLALRIIAGLLVAAVVVIVFALAYRRLHTLTLNEGEEEVDETRELILSTGLLKAQLAQLFAGGRDGAHGRPFVIVAGDDPAAQVRRTYQALLGWAAAQGLPRQPGVTPAEYAVLLSHARPADADAIAAITRVYLEARYAASPMSPAGAERAALAWQEIMATTQHAARPSMN